MTFTRAAYCENYATLSLPDNWPDCCTTSHEYYIGDSSGYYEVPEFQITEFDCEILYSVTSDIDGTGLYTDIATGRGVHWYSDDITFAN